MYIDLSGRTAIVTGSTEGIGLAIAHGLSRAGATIVVNGRSQATVDAAIAALREAGHAARGVAADIATAEGCAAIIAAEPVADILVNNAAYVAWADFLDLDDAAWALSWQTNVMAAARLCRHYLPAMAAAGFGRVLFISSESARNVQPELIAYGASKLALHALSRGIAKRMRATDVTSNVMVVGPTLSDGVKRMLQPQVDALGLSYEAAGDRFVGQNRPTSVIGRMATVDEVAAMAVYLCSIQAAATSGSALRVDGGVVDDVN